MSIEARIESLDGEELNYYICRSGSAYCYLDEYTSRLLLARPKGGYEQSVVVHAKDGYDAVPEDITIEDLKKISVPDTIIAEIMPWSRRTFEVHEIDGQKNLLTIASLPLVQIFPVRETAY